MKPHMVRLLKHSARIGIRKLAVSCTHRSVPDSMLGGSSLGSVASNPIKYDGWPAIWEATKRAGLGSRGGNHNQTWVNDSSNLEPGLYVLDVEARQWSRIYTPSYTVEPKAVCAQCSHTYAEHTQDAFNHCVDTQGKQKYNYHRMFLHSGRVRGARKQEPAVVLTLTSKA